MKILRLLGIFLVLLGIVMIPSVWVPFSPLVIGLGVFILLITFIGFIASLGLFLILHSLLAFSGQLLNFIFLLTGPFLFIEFFLGVVLAYWGIKRKYRL